MTRHVAVVAFAALLALAAEPPVPIIFDTDMGGDCDDVGALFILHGAVQRGEAKLVAAMCCTSSDYIAPCVDAMNTWFGRPEIPVGTLKDRGLLADPAYPKTIAEHFPHKFATGKEYPDAVALYRQILAKQPDKSIVVLAVGPLRNLKNLLESRGDDASPLDGRALVAKKVKRLELMGGTYPPSADPKEGEWNFKQDPAAAALVCSSWPTPILFNGEGGSTNSGRRVTYQMPEHNPLTMAYTAYPGVGFAGDRLSWDSISALVAVRGAAPWYKIVSGGVNVVDPKTGVNTWKAGEDRGHSYLVLDTKLAKSEVEKALEDMMVAGIGRPSKLTFNTAYYTADGMCQITGQGAVDAEHAPLKAFDRRGKPAASWWDRAASSWIQCRYADGRKYAVTSYAVVCPEPKRAPQSLQLAGSNDGGATWIAVDVREAPDFSAKTPRREFTISKPAQWNSYRLLVTALDEKEGVQIASVELNEAINCHPNVTAQSLTLDESKLTLPVHGRATLNASVTPGDTFNRQIAWRSSDPAVADVRHIGEQIAMVVGKAPGTCTLTAAIDGVQQTCAVTVTPSTLPTDFRYEELSNPPIPGAAAADGDAIVLTGCGHGMTSWWERLRDQGVFVSTAATRDCTISARLTSLAPNVGGPTFLMENSPPTAAGLMIREATEEKCGRYVLIQVEASGELVCRWRDKSGDPDDNQKKVLGKVALPCDLKLVKKGDEIQVFAAAGGAFGAPKMSHRAAFDAGGRLGLFICSGNTFASSTARFAAVKLSK